MIEKIRDQLKTVRKIVTLSAPRHGDWDAFAAWRDRHADRDPTLPARPRTRRCSSTLSGTTGLPKGAELTNANFSSMLPLWTESWLLGPGVPNLICLPMFHIGGAGWGIAGLYAGATNHVVREFVPARDSRDHAARAPAGDAAGAGDDPVPAAGAADPRDRPLQPAADRLWRGADPGRAAEAGDVDLRLRLPAGLWPDRDDRRHHAPAARGSRSDADAKKLLSCGFAQKGVELRIVDDDGTDAADRQGRRDRRALATGHGRLLAPARRHQARHSRRLVLHRRRGLSRRQGLSLHLRPGEGHDRVGRREHLSGRGRERAVRPSGRRRRGGDRRARRTLGRGREGRRGDEARQRASAPAS